MNESALTGESMPAEKNVAPYDPSGPPPELTYLSLLAAVVLMSLHSEAKSPQMPKSPPISRAPAAGKEEKTSSESEIHRLNCCFLGTAVESGSALGVSSARQLQASENAFSVFRWLCAPEIARSLGRTRRL